MLYEKNIAENNLVPRAFDYVVGAVGWWLQIGKSPENEVEKRMECNRVLSKLFSFCSFISVLFYLGIKYLQL